MNKLIVLALLGSICSIFAEPVTPDPCSTTKNDACEVSNIQVSPCPEAANNEPCKLKRGKQANIQFDFMPHFNDNSPKSRAYWSAAFVDLPFVGMDTDACKYATCPIVSGQQNHYNYTLDIDRKFLAQRYNVKWKIWMNSETEKKECCFIFKMRLV